MKKHYSVYLTPAKYLKIKMYAATTGRTFSQFMAWLALAELSRHRPKESPFPAPGYATESDYKALAERIRHYL